MSCFVQNVECLSSKYLMRIGGWTPKHPLRRLLEVPNTNPHKVFGGFWKGYRLETTLRILRVRKDGNRLTVYLYHFLRWYVRDFNHPRYPSNKLKQIQENDFKLPSLICQIIQRIHFWRILTAPPPPTQNWHFHFCGIWAGCVFSSPKRVFSPLLGPGWIITRMSVRHPVFRVFIGLWK